MACVQSPPLLRKNPEGREVFTQATGKRASK